MKSSAVAFIFSLLILFCPTPALAEGLSVDELVGLKQMGYTDDEILKELERTKTRLKLSPAELQRLRKAGAGPALLRVLSGGGATTGGDLVTQVIAWTRARKPAVWILQQIASRPASQRSPSQVLPAFRAGAKRSVVFALRGKPLSAADLLTLSKNRTSADEVRILAKLVGLGFRLDVSQSLKLMRQGVPKAWFPILKRAKQPAASARGEEVEEVEPETPGDRWGPTPPYPTSMERYRDITGLYDMKVPAGWHEIQHSTSGFGSTTHTPFSSAKVLDRIPAGLDVTFEFFQKGQPTLALPISELGPKMVRFLLLVHPDLREDERMRSSEKIAGHEAYWSGYSGRIEGVAQPVVGMVVYVRAGRLLYSIQVTCRAKDQASYLPGLKQVIRSFNPTPPSERRVDRLPRAMDASDLTSRYKRSVVWVSASSVGGGGSGSGFVVRSDGYVLTNQHVIWNDRKNKFHEEITIHWDESLDMEPRRAKIIGAFKTPLQALERQGIDLALLKIEGTGYTPVKMTPARSVELADPVLVVGFPKTSGGGSAGLSGFSSISLVVTRGVLTRMNRLADGSINSFIVDAKITHGNSGGPCFNLKTGGVMGLNTFTFASLGTDLAGYEGVIPIDLALGKFPQILTYPIGALNRMTVAHRMKLANIFLAQKMEFAATEEFLKVLRLEPNNAAAMIAVADLMLLKAKKTREAKEKKKIEQMCKEFLRKAEVFIVDHRRHVNDLEYLASYYCWTARDYRRAVALCDRILRINRTRWAAYDQRAWAYAMLNNKAAAYRDLAKSREYLEDLLPHAWVSSGYIANRFGDREKAHRFFNTAKSKFRNSVDAHLGYIDYCQRAGKTREAGEVFREADLRFRKSALFQHRYGKFLIQQGKPGVAKRHCEMAFRLYKEVHGEIPIDVCEDLGQLYLDGNQEVTCLQTFVAGLRSDPGSKATAGVYARLADFYWRKRKSLPPGLAWAHLARALELNPKHAVVQKMKRTVIRQNLTLESVAFLGGEIAEQHIYPPGLVMDLIIASRSRLPITVKQAQAMVKLGVHQQVAIFLLELTEKVWNKGGSTRPPAGTPPPGRQPTASKGGVELVKFEPFVAKRGQEIKGKLTWINRNRFPIKRIRFTVQGLGDGERLVLKQTWTLMHAHLLPNEKKTVTCTLFRANRHGVDKMRLIKSIVIKADSISYKRVP